MQGLRISLNQGCSESRPEHTNVKSKDPSLSIVGALPNTTVDLLGREEGRLAAVVADVWNKA